ncbi:hypothetical protein L195_g018112 [Trifolium pratense]|uniref:Uncharacterized protein n=1 Tax=Trifolium pratense TaxID=57577 RepID=A0A2K3MVU4_TRIPR|nr:hypothetical protein L195_g018112 [Trifolium pratense]
MIICAKINRLFVRITMIICAIGHVSGVCCFFVRVILYYNGFFVWKYAAGALVLILDLNYLYKHFIPYLWMDYDNDPLIGV